MTPVARLRAWRALARKISVGGPLSLTFRVDRDRRTKRLKLRAFQRDAEHLFGGDRHDLEFFHTIPESFRPSAHWILGFARWIYLHELDEWWTTAAGRTRVPHDCDGKIRPDCNMSLAKWRALAEI